MSSEVIKCASYAVMISQGTTQYSAKRAAVYHNELLRTKWLQTVSMKRLYFELNIMYYYYKHNGCICVFVIFFHIQIK